MSGIRVKTENGVSCITIDNQRKRNAINYDMYLELTECLNNISNDDMTAITVLTGSGDFYSSGNDFSLSATKTDDLPKMIAESQARVRNFVDAIISHKKILVAVVNGPAIGIAATTLPLFDIVYCCPTTWFLTPFTRLGICAEGCSSYTFPKVLGYSKANEMLLFGMKLTAEEALKSGFVSKIIPKEEVDNLIWTVLTNYVAELSKQSLIATKKLIRRFDEKELYEANRQEIKQLKELYVTEETQQYLLKAIISRGKKSKL